MFMRLHATDDAVSLCFVPAPRSAKTKIAEILRHLRSAQWHHARMQTSARHPLDIRAAGVLEALGGTSYLVIWELLRRIDRPVSADELAKASGSPRAVVQAALDAFERIALVARRRATNGKRGFGWVVSCPAIVVQYRVGDPVDQALLQQLDAVFDQRRRAEIAGKIKPEATRGGQDFAWTSMHAGSFNEAEIKELWDLLQGLTRFFARAGDRFKGAPITADHHCSHHVSVSVDPLLHGVLPLPNLQIIGQQAATSVVKAIAADWSQALTVREAEIARGLARGKSRDSFAEELGISKHTVVEYTRRIYRKLGVKNRAQLSARIHTGG